MTSTRALFVLLSVLLSTPGVAAQEGWQQPESWTEPIEPFRIADGLYHVGTAELTALLLTGEDGHVLIDAPLEENVGRMLENIESLGFDPADVKVQLISHGHFDHAGGVAALLEATGAELVLSRAGAELVEAGGRGDFFLGEDASYPGIAADFCGSVARLRRLEPDIFLSSHGSFIGLAGKAEALAGGQARAFVDPDRYRRFLDRAGERIEAVLAEQGEPGGCAAILAAPGSGRSR